MSAAEASWESRVYGSAADEPDEREEQELLKQQIRASQQQTAEYERQLRESQRRAQEEAERRRALAEVEARRRGRGHG